MSSWNLFFLSFFKSLFILAVQGLRCCMSFSLLAANRGYSLVAAHRLLIAVASLVEEHRL